MTADRKLRPAPSVDGSINASLSATIINRRQFMGYSLNAAGGVLAASLGALGFASILLPPGGGGGGDLQVKFWAKGREDEAWYGAQHLQGMTKSAFVEEAAKSNVGISGAQGVWNGLPVNVTYVPHAENKDTAVADDVPRFQFMEGYDLGGNYVGHFEDITDADPELFNPDENLVMVFSRCTHLCCIPGWQLVANAFTDDNWTPGGGDGGGSKMFCICHSSRFDPTALEMNQNTNRSNGQQFQYAGIRRAGGPAPVGLPLVPIIMNGDAIEGATTHLDWLTYCD